eukprot:CAMPEP_0180017672 /NCGR_PEP_ID=MMETSP0984-20121128/20020_1 /TAXON_ID=483367 /ORGANISM="non described non described, Strain CCMP 2436" /LENGTH=73 /DNA_ID=CAMNT_0021940799 /DNA_START=113 /DNA_END=330 /DNA_ORIENTATION=-
MHETHAASLVIQMRKELVIHGGSHALSTTPSPAAVALASPSEPEASELPPHGNVARKGAAPARAPTSRLSVMP